MTVRSLALALVLACHHDPSPPTTPADQRPLPPASGTPIGFLIDDASELHLTDDQLAKLRDIDSGLAAELDVIDTKLREANRPADSGSAAPPSGMGRRGGRRGGMGGMGGGMGGSPSGGGGRHGGGHRGSGSGSATSYAGDANRLTEERAADVRDAIYRAFGLLEPAQQATAKKVLEAHDVDLDTGRSTGETSPTSGEPSEPGDGSGEP